MFVSGTLPFWLFTLGRLLEIPDDLPTRQIYIASALNLGLLVAPCVAGVLVRRLKPKWADWIEKILRPVTIVLMFVLVIVGVATYWHLWSILTWTQVLPSAALTGIAYVVAIALSVAVRLGKDRAITNAIEAAMQNGIIVIVMMNTLFSRPESDIASLIPLAYFMLSPVPLYVWLLALGARRLWHRFSNVKVTPDTGEGHPPQAASQSNSRQSPRKLTADSLDDSWAVPSSGTIRNLPPRRLPPIVVQVAKIDATSSENSTEDKTLQI